MQLTIDLPEMLSNDRISQLINKIEQIFLKEGLSFDIKKESLAEYDSWDALDIEEISVDTGVTDFAENHDYYLYGTSKKS
ncbi:conserved hypothetical protein [Beggiatoa sp. PS]|nr:conserved hypothetical protein [Beggiatoa sp. PS]